MPKIDSKTDKTGRQPEKGGKHILHKAPHSLLVQHLSIPHMHKEKAPKRLKFYIAVVSTSRYKLKKEGKPVNDVSGYLMQRYLAEAGQELVARKIIPDEWEIDPNNDYCVDFKRKGIEIDKEYTANLLARSIFQHEDYVITNVGDKPGDMLKGENTINYPQFGTKAYAYCKKEGIPHIPVVHAGDYSMILAEAIRISKET